MPQKTFPTPFGEVSIQIESPVVRLRHPVSEDRYLKTVLDFTEAPEPHAAAQSYFDAFDQQRAHGVAERPFSRKTA
jgi:hypothetical protein